MIYSDLFSIPEGRAVCYSGFRKGQQPGVSYPSYLEVKEDLHIVQEHWQYIRLYSCDAHSKTVLEVIKNEALSLKVMLGAYIVAEENNPNCPWDGGMYSEAQLKKNREKNSGEISELIRLANEYPEIVFSLSVGNEACVDWTDHLVPVNRVIEYVKKVQQKAKQPVTFCENYEPWLHKLEPLAEVVDFISIHTYPVWEYKTIDQAMNFTQQNYIQVAEKYPNKAVVITEAGWATTSNGEGIPKENVNEIFQKIYFQELNQWSEQDKVLTFVFEAFDELWKGSPDPYEPEKHWGLFTEERLPKLAVKKAEYKR
jgi:exo-beta-1,3-glucanase (GH17 family)